MWCFWSVCNMQRKTKKKQCNIRGRPGNSRERPGNIWGRLPISKLVLFHCRCVRSYQISISGHLKVTMLTFMLALRSISVHEYTFEPTRATIWKSQQMIETFFILKIGRISNSYFYLQRCVQRIWHLFGPSWSPVSGTPGSCRSFLHFSYTFLSQRAYYGMRRVAELILLSPSLPWITICLAYCSSKYVVQLLSVSGLMCCSSKYDVQLRGCPTCTC